jgi:hypothetical protein
VNWTLSDDASPISPVSPHRSPGQARATWPTRPIQLVAGQIPALTLAQAGHLGIDNTVVALRMASLHRHAELQDEPPAPGWNQMRGADLSWDGLGGHLVVAALLDPGNHDRCEALQDRWHQVNDPISQCRAFWFGRLVIFLGHRCPFLGRALRPHIWFAPARSTCSRVVAAWRQIRWPASWHWPPSPRPSCLRIPVRSRAVSH